MSVEFEESSDTLQTYSSRKILGESVEPAITKTLIKIGITKNTKQAYRLLLGISFISFLISLVIFGYYILGIGNPTVTKTSIPPDINRQLNTNFNAI